MGVVALEIVVVVVAVNVVVLKRKDGVLNKVLVTKQIRGKLFD